MNYILFTAIIFICLYGTIRKPGIVLAYILFFQILNKMLFMQFGFESFRYITTILFIPIILLLHYKKLKIKPAIRNFLRDKITLGYFLLVIYMILYGYYIGTSYELEYIKMFVFPGVLIFIIGGIFFFNSRMYKDLFYGIILFSIITFISINFFGNFGEIFEVARTSFKEITGISPITQGQITGLLVIFSLIIIQFQRVSSKIFGFLLLIFSLFWLGLTGTRGPLVAIILTIMFYLIFTYQKKTSLKKILVYISLSIPILMFLGFTESLLFTRASDLLNPEYIETSKRFYRYILFFEFLPDNFVFGLGPGGWGKHVMIGDYRYPHNIIIEFIIEYGIIGMISFLLISLTVIRKSIKILKSPQNNWYINSILLAWIYFAIAAMFSGSFITNNEFFTFSAIIVGINRCLSS